MDGWMDGHVDGWINMKKRLMELLCIMKTNNTFFIKKLIVKRIPQVPPLMPTFFIFSLTVSLKTRFNVSPEN